MKNKTENTQGGFIQIIIFIILAVFLLSYLNISISEIMGWFQEVF